MALNKISLTRQYVSLTSGRVKKRIVLIENDDSLSLIICSLLESHGYHVLSFNHFTTKEELTSLSANIFIIEERLPIISGHIISIILRSFVETSQVPQILMSAGPVLDKFAGLSEVDTTLKKPFELSDLLTLVSSLIT